MVGRLTLQLFCFFCLPSYICDVASSLTLSARLSLSLSTVHYSVSLPLPLFLQPTPHPPSLPFPVSVFQQIVFSSLLLELQPDASLILSLCQISLLVQATPLYSRQPMTKQSTPLLQIHTHTQKHVCRHDACCRMRGRGRKQLNATEVEIC